MSTTSTDLLAGLNPEQVRAVTAPAGPTLVIAGPGSGKTRVLTHRIAWLISEQGIPAWRILAVTFTNKAAREMRQRVEQLISTGAAAGMTMGTFHSFGVRLLRENPGLLADRLGVLRNFTIYDDADQQAILKQVIANIGRDPKDLPPRRVQSRISAYKSGLIEPADAAETAATYDDEVMARAYAEYQRLLRRANAVDFDDLLILPIKLFDTAPEVLEKYQDRFEHILVDEYQDTNRVQYVLVEALAQKHKNLFVVGDPDQSIYRWRQADIRNILDFQKSFDQAQRVDLEVNYRSTARIVAVADNVIRLNRDRIDRKLRTDNDDGDQVSIRELADQQHEADFVVSEIRRLMRDRNLNGDDFAVMYRTTAQSRVLEEAFRVSDLPYQIVGGVRFYDRKEVKDVLAAFKLIVNPNDTISIERVIENMPVGRGLGPKAMETIDQWSIVTRRTPLDGLIAVARNELDAPQLSGAARTAAIKIGAAYDELQKLEQIEPLTDLFDAVVRLTGYRDQLAHGDDDQLERWENVLEVRADMEKYDELEPGEALAAYLEQVALVADVDSLDDDSRGRVTLITLHSAKGLEFPVVFITGLEEGLLPVSRAVEAEFTDPAAIEEERRLFYVGITRAEQLLYITYVANRLTWGRYQPGVASRFLDSLPHEHVRDLGRRSTVSPRGGMSLTGRAQTLSGLSMSTLKPAPIPPKAQVRAWSAGEKIFHPKFGEGTIIEVQERRGDQELAIEFTRHGQKRLLASLAPIELITD
ncbi:MAG: UvrD-helicase domain-containing protein [Thermomicrobiales bacterium]|nr:UvrD-helicase domain-containing protein [Thermomicrobiales bacterium]